MNKITKKEFLDLHHSNKLIGIAAHTMTKEYMAGLIASCLVTGNKLPEFPVSRIDLNKYDTCYKDDNFIFVESVNPDEWPNQTIAYRIV